MALTPRQSEAFDRLLFALRDDALTPETATELERIALSDDEAMRRYLSTVNLCVGLRWITEAAGQSQEAEEVASRGRDGAGIAALAEPAEGERLCPPIILDLAVPGSQSPGLFAPGGMVFSYAVSLLVVAFGLLVAWTSTIAPHQQVAQAPRPSVEPVADVEPEMHFVGRITGMVDCQAADASAQPIEGAHVAMGRRFVLNAGLLEITYDTGARVLLQGPCTYDVDSKGSGYLAIGRLTASMEKNVASEAATTNHSPLTTRHSPLFTIRTPTAIVTDLGTEFAVEVDRTGASKAHVFQGRVEMRLNDGREVKNPTAVSLGENESAHVAVGQDLAIKVVRGSPEIKQRFARRIPKRAPLVLFNTGAGLKEGDPDPHWHLVARSDDPKFAPRPAVVTPIYTIRQPGKMEIHTFQLPNDARSQWLSAVSDLSFLPNGVTYTFRTTFDLSGLLPETAVLRGRFIGDDHVTAIRLNGRKLEIPTAGHTTFLPFYEWRVFKATAGFVAGENVLEIDVWNGPYPTTGASDASSLMACRVELEGSAVRDWQVDQKADQKNESKNGAHQNSKNPPTQEPLEERGKEVRLD